MQRKDVIGIGAMNVDRLYHVSHILKEDEIGYQGGPDQGIPIPPHAEMEEHIAGGSAANTIYGLAKLGIKTGFVSAVGNDADGQRLIESLRSVGVDTRIAVKNEAPTGSAVCLVDGKGRRDIYVSPGANNLLTLDDLPMDYLSQASIVHLSSLVGEGQFHLVQEVVASLPSSAALSFAPGTLYSAKGLDGLHRILKRVTLLFTNRQEMEQLTGQEFSAGAGSCLAEGCRTVVVTLGAGIEMGRTLTTCYIRDREDELLIKPQGSRQKAVDTTGAGDAFIAGFLFGLLRGKEMERCGLLGDLMARFCIAQMGARGALPSFDELAETYRQLYQRGL